MSNKENQPGFFRKAEPTVEKTGGAVIAILGVLSWEFQPVVLGALIYLIGKWRTPKTT